MTIKAIVLTLIILSTFSCSKNGDNNGPVRIGSKVFTESVILGEIITQLAQPKGVNAQHSKELGGTRVLWNALLRGDIDAYPEYTGTVIEEILSDEHVHGFEALREELRRRNILMSEPLGFNNTYALGMKRDVADKLGIDTISNLKDHPGLRIGFTNEFMDRNDGWPGLRKEYALPQSDVKGLAHDLAYRGLDAQSVDVIDLYSTDAEIDYYDIKVLEDDRHYFTDYNAVVLYRADLVNRHPAFRAAVRSIENKIPAETIINLNSSVPIDGDSESAAASRFIKNNLSIETEPRHESFESRLYGNTVQHLFLVSVSLTAAILISIPLGIAAFRNKKLGRFILGIVGIIQTMPSLALLVFMIPLFGIGTVPAIAALFLYSLLPIVRNTYSGLEDIPDDIRESALVLGLSSFAVLRLIELPLASRAILSGIKTSAVINVGTATLGALIGAGGYGQPILTGIRLDDIGLILEGAVPAALMALLVQGLFDLLERVAVPEGLRSEKVD